MKEEKLAAVFEGTKQARENRARWAWVEPAVWTDRMLTALEEGVKGGQWFSLMDKVYRPANLEKAWQRVQANAGAAGVDHQTVEMFERQAATNLEKLSEELCIGQYQPKAVKRVWIPKPGSKQERPLGIPTIRDRVVQAALCQVLEPIFERDFAEHSYGFRPNRGAKDALRRVDHLLHQGCTWVVDADLKSYFDTIPHDQLLARVGGKVSDGRVLDLVAAFLQQGVLEETQSWTPEAGTPQGGVVSPLLSNIYLDPLDQLMVQRGIVDAQQRGGFDFLGYHFERGYKWPRQKSLEKLKATIRSRTRRTAGHSLSSIIAQLNPRLTGWFQYFQHSHRTTFHPLDAWIRMRLRSILRRRQGRRGRGRGGRPSSLVQCLLCGTGAVFPTRGPCFCLSILTQGDPLTGEPDAGDLHVRFGGRGNDGSPYPYPVHGDFGYSFSGTALVQHDDGRMS